MIPKCSGPYAALPAGRYTVSFDVMYQRFVEEAPFRERRELIFKAIELHSEIVRMHFNDARLWIDGGFVTHKTWAEPEDADVVVVVSVAQYAKLATEEALLPLASMLGVTSLQPNTSTGKLHPMGGLMDVFFVPDNPFHLEVWDDRWSSVNGPDGVLIPGERKGYLEVIL